MIGLNGTSDGIAGRQGRAARGDRSGRLRPASARETVKARLRLITKQNLPLPKIVFLPPRHRDEGERRLDPELGRADQGDQVARSADPGACRPRAGAPRCLTRELELRPILDAEGVHKRYGGVHALRGAGLTIYPGEVHALVGENGSGKSTLLKILSGQVQPDGGAITLDGRPTSFRDPTDALRQGIATVTPGDDPGARPLDRREHLPRAPHGAARPA